MENDVFAKYNPCADLYRGVSCSLLKIEKRLLQIIMQDKIKLGQIADISMGQSFRGKLVPSTVGGVQVIQMKDLGHDCGVAGANLIRVDEPGVRERNYVRRGDLVFRSRGQTNTAVLLDQNLSNAVVAAPLYRIRVSEGILPEYLLWCINLPVSQAWLASHARGTAVKIITRQSVAEFELKLPPIEIQQKISEIASFSETEQKLMAKLAEKRKQYMDGILMQMASESQ